MSWTTTFSLDVFEAAAGPFLRARPVENSVLLTVCAALRGRGPDAYGATPPQFGWWRDGEGAVAAAFLRTPPHPMLLARAPQAAVRELAAGWDGPLTGVRGDGGSARELAAAWRERTGAVVTADRHLRLYRLGVLIPPRPGPPGRARVAGPDDGALLVDWHRAFAADIGELPTDDRRAVLDAAAQGARTLWEAGGAPVAMAGVTPAVAGTVRVVAVYTPPCHRGRGYAGAVTAAVSQAARDAGAADVVLFADLANPVSNRVYQRLGYLPLRDHVTLRLTTGGT